jgi:hypothetical protein
MMADANIKKVIIPYNQLPASYSNNNAISYNVRYRIISEDRNRASHWSRVYTINAATNDSGDPLINPYTFNYIKESVNNGTSSVNAIRLNWQITSGATVPVIPSSYDIFVSRDSGSYTFLDNTVAQTYTVLRTGTETTIRIAVQAPTYPQERSTASELFVTSAIDITTVP